MGKLAYLHGMEQEFWNLVDIRSNDECWPWKGYIRRKNGAQFYTNDNIYSAVKIAYELAFDPLPKRVPVHNICGTICCCNPAHLYARDSPDSLWKRLNKSANQKGCWEWTGYRDKSGYGDVKYLKVSMRTHRLAWELINGPIPEGMLVCHRCDNPPCCNPEHLFIGTPKDNAQDMRSKKRWKKRPPPTAILSPADVQKFILWCFNPSSLSPLPR